MRHRPLSSIKSFHTPSNLYTRIRNRGERTVAKDWGDQLEELIRRQADVREMGGLERIERQHAGDRMTIRDRINALPHRYRYSITAAE